MPATPITFGPDGLRDVGDHRVYMKEHWVDAWSVQDHVYCLEAVWSCAPTLPTATLLWRYGKVKQVNTSNFIEYAKQSGLSRWFVKIEIDTDLQADGITWNTKTWYGVIELGDDQLWGSVFTQAGSVIASGEQTLTCYGLEKLLVDHLILDSNVIYFGGGALTERGLTFNRDGIGNRTLAKVGDSYLFESDPDSGELWTSEDIVEYLLVNQTPIDSTGAVLIPFALNAAHHVPDWDRPEISQEGQTTYSLLDRLINRKRLLLWWLTVEPPTPPDTLDIVTLNTNTIVGSVVTIPLTGSPTVEANTAQLNLIFDRDQLTSACLRSSDIQTVDVVIAKGARRRSVGSFSFVDATLENGWTNAEEVAYKAGASGDADYASLNIKDKQKRNADVRNSPALNKVYSFFQIPYPWDFRVGDGFGSYPSLLFMPSGLLATTQYFRDLYIEQTMPLIVGVDYSGSKIPDGTIVEPDRDREEMTPLVVFMRPETSGATERWIRADAIGETVALEESDEDANNRFSCSVRVPQDSRGLFVVVHGQPGQHAIGTYYFTRLPVDEHPGGYDYDNGKMIVTMSLVDDRRIEGRWPAAEPTGVDAIRYMVIDAGDGYRKDYVAPNTVVDVDSNGSLIRSDGGYIPDESADDDEHKLIALAKIAASWYTVIHQILSLETKRLRVDIGLGNLVAAIGDPAIAGGHNATINSPVTQISIAIPKDGSDPVMSVDTWAGELDPMQIMPLDVRKSLSGTFGSAGEAYLRRAYEAGEL